MKRTLLLGVGLLVLYSLPGDVGAADKVHKGRLHYDGHYPYYQDRDHRGRQLIVDRPYARRGQRARRYGDRFSFSVNLYGDKKNIYEEYGYTPHRLKKRFAGTWTERWKYYSLGLEFVFDEDDNLIRTHRFWSEVNHID